MVKDFFCKEAHCELSRSDAAEAYCNKEDTRVADTQFEFGKKPFKRNSKVDWDAIWEDAKQGRIDNIPADIRIRNYTTLKRIGVDNMQPVMRNGIVVKCFYGGTGLGKTRKAWFEAGDDCYVKDPCTKWWDGYKGQDKVIIDEFTGLINIAHLLRWFDRYPCNAEIKGFSVPLRATQFWITSNLNPRDWYKDITEDQVQALLRRMNVTQFIFEWQPPMNPNPNDILDDLFSTEY